MVNKVDRYGHVMKMRDVLIALESISLFKSGLCSGLAGEITTI